MKNEKQTSGMKPFPAWRHKAIALKVTIKFNNLNHFSGRAEVFYLN
jgi:hypothetical protein